jgi:hypothetical protein
MVRSLVLMLAVVSTSLLTACERLPPREPGESEIDYKHRVDIFMTVKRGHVPNRTWFQTFGVKTIERALTLPVDQWQDRLDVDQRGKWFKLGPAPLCEDLSAYTDASSGIDSCWLISLAPNLTGCQRRGQIPELCGDALAARGLLNNQEALRRLALIYAAPCKAWPVSVQKPTPPYDKEPSYEELFRGAHFIFDCTNRPHTKVWPVKVVLQEIGTDKFLLIPDDLLAESK